MDGIMKQILSRVLSEEVGRQEKWQDDDMERFGRDVSGRDNVISAIREFMTKEGIEFRDDFYMDGLR